VPEEPASFMKGDHTVIGPGEPIPIPPRSARTTAEAELGLVIGRHCRNVSEADALDHLVSFGPEIVPLAEVLDGLGTLTNPVVQS
jgi:2-keto-4-pentenoate hydratase/2-oxohepta-3-ene-1,7-dioic acid hydratase in catechol pathway